MNGYAEAQMAIIEARWDATRLEAARERQASSARGRELAPNPASDAARSPNRAHMTVGPRSLGAAAAHDEAGASAAHDVPEAPSPGSARTSVAGTCCGTGGHCEGSAVAA
jgi:hypothetical protein